VRENEDWLVRRVLDHARRNNYVKYTSDQPEAWRNSVAGLSRAFLSYLSASERVPELDPDEDYTLDPIASFGRLEARRYRARGVTLGMFLSLAKYYRQSYLDLVLDAGLDREREKHCTLLVNRFFDRMELGYCAEWTQESEKARLAELQESNRAVTIEKNRYLTVFESLPTPVVLLDCRGRIDNLNDAAAELLFGHSMTPRAGYHSEVWKHKDLLGLVDELRDFASRSDELEARFEKELQTSHGLRHFEVKLTRTFDLSGSSSNTTIVFLSDLTERKQAETQLAFMAAHDPLTGLPNRRALDPALERLISRAREGDGDGDGMTSVLLFVDLDHFKDINDALGHGVGDRVLVALVELLRTQLRARDLIARVGGDEFVILLEEVSVEEACLVAERMRSAVDTLPFVLDGHSVQTSISAGLVLIDGDSDADAALARGDAAMYEAKLLGRNRVVVFSPPYGSASCDLASLSLKRRRRADWREPACSPDAFAALAADLRSHEQGA
jgi:diguanylate cyclase